MQKTQNFKEKKSRKDKIQKRKTTEIKKCKKTNIEKTKCKLDKCRKQIIWKRHNVEKTK